MVRYVRCRAGFRAMRIGSQWGVRVCPEAVHRFLSLHDALECLRLFDADGQDVTARD